MNDGTMTFASLFSGCGGFDLGFVARGFRSVGAFDCDPEAVENFAVNVAGPVNRVDLTQGIPDEQSLCNVDALIAGPQSRSPTWSEIIMRVGSRSSGLKRSICQQHSTAYDSSQVILQSLWLSRHLAPNRLPLRCVSTRCSRARQSTTRNQRYTTPNIRAVFETTILPPP